MKKRMISVLLILALAFTLLPSMALAADGTAEVKTADELVAALADPSVTTIRLLGTTDDVLVESKNGQNVVTRDLTFDMQRHQLHGEGTLSVSAGCTLTIVNGSTISGGIANDGVLDGGGAFVANGVTCGSGAEIKSGYYPRATGEGVPKPKISGGHFGTMNVSSSAVSGFLIEDGEFGERVTSITDCVISGGTFYCDVTDQLAENVSCHIVTYDMGDGTAKQQYIVGTNSRASAPRATTRESDGRTLTGWYLDEAYQEPYDFSSPVTDDLTLYARWEGVYGYITADGARVPVTESNCGDVLGDGTVCYTPESDTRTDGLTDEEWRALYRGEPVEGYTPATLTLNGAKLDGIQFSSMLKLVLQGENKLHGCIESLYNGLILLVGGEGSLTITSGSDAPFYADAYFQYGGNVTVTADPFYFSTGNILLVFGGTLTVQITGETEELDEYAITNMAYSAYRSALGFAKLLTENTELRIGLSETETISMLLTQDQEELESRWQALLAEAESKWGDTAWEKLQYLRLSAPEPEEPEAPTIGAIGAGALLLAGDDNPFRDVRAVDWYYKDVMYAYRRGLVNGTAYNKFSPQERFTRGMLLTILARYDGVRTEKGAAWYEAGCAWAAKNGISDGKNPEEAISREEFAVVLYRYAKYLGKDTLAGADLSSYLDAGEVSEDALGAMQWAVGEAIVRGHDFRLHPQDGTTRAEACAMLHRFFKA